MRDVISKSLYMVGSMLTVYDILHQRVALKFSDYFFLPPHVPGHIHSLFIANHLQ